jgi:pimeloyl-ACP methyl ester carboxylesterase
MADRSITTPEGVRISYRTAGRGPRALVFVHGWCSNLTHWQAQLDHFGDRHRVLAVDRRGHGRSDAPARGYTAKQHAADLASVIAEERMRRVVVVAHAGGGPGALAFARDNPSLVEALVLVDTHVSARAALGRPRTPERSALGALIDLLDGPGGDAAFEAMYRGYFSDHAGPVADRAVAEARRVPRRVAQAELASMAISTEGLARSLRLPVLWITVAAADEARLSSIFRDVQFGRVVGSGHFPHLEVPDQVNAMIDRFVVTLPRR